MTQSMTAPTTSSVGITESIRRTTSNYVARIKQGASQILSSASSRRRRGSVPAVTGNIFKPDLHEDEQHPGQCQTKQKVPSGDSETDFYSKWIVLGKAGSGGQFDVFFVIGKHWLQSEAWSLVDGLNQHREPGELFKFVDDDSARSSAGKYLSLTEGVCVAKVPVKSPKSPDLRKKLAEEGIPEANDFAILRQFGADSKYTPHLVDWDRLQEKPAWVVQEAYNCATLFEFNRVWHRWHANTRPVPESLIWHVFIDLSLALHYMHCAGIAHCDLVSFNVCLHVPRRDFKNARFPRAIPIDFGRARRGESMERHLCRWDMTCLGDMIHDMVHGLQFRTDGRIRHTRDYKTGLCNCIDLPEARRESRLSRRGRTLYREVMRYTAEGSTKTVQDVLAKLIEHAKTARKDTYVALPDGILELLSRRFFPTEEKIWERMRQHQQQQQQQQQQNQQQNQQQQPPDIF